MRLRTWVMAIAAITLDSALSASGQEAAAKAPDAVELAKELANPISSLISVPFQFNADEKYGLGDEGSKSSLIMLPVLPFALNADWNVITRTIIPLLDQHDIPAKGVDNSGLGDITASQFFSPQKKQRGWTWGVGPVELFPTASDETLGAEQWGLGPSFVGLWQGGPWTFGLLCNHIWSVAGEEERPDVDATFLQPFMNYVTKTKTTFLLNSESTYDWEGEAWSAPVNAGVAQMLRIGKQPAQIAAVARYWAESPADGPEGWGARLQVVLLFPK